jgi:5-methylcytosine-specific restriction enzyme A
MAGRAAKLCGQPGCSELVPCPLHTRKPWEGSTRAQELPPDWQRRRRYVLLRDPVCTVCGEHVSTEVDHIKAGNDHSYENLRGICAPCHKDKTQREAAHGRAERSEH